MIQLSVYVMPDVMDALRRIANRNGDSINDALDRAVLTYDTLTANHWRRVLRPIVLNLGVIVPILWPLWEWLSHTWWGGPAAMLGTLILSVPAVRWLQGRSR